MTARPRTTKDDVVKAAGKLFSERGFHGTSMRDLGGVLGLEGSSLYAHITGKDQLLLEVISRGAAMFQGLADEVLSSQDPPDVKLRSLIHGHVLIVVDHIDEARTFLNEARFLPEPQRTRVLELRRRYQDAYEEVIRRGMAAGLWRQHPPQLMAIFILSVLNALDRWYRPQGLRSPQDLAVDIYEFVTGGLS
ncbi:MAG TPA: TetR/AcrR family transcriptional regulator [Acidimicrobiia bacterium]